MDTSTELAGRWLLGNYTLFCGENVSCSARPAISNIIMAIPTSDDRPVTRESRMQGQLACPVWRGLGRDGSQEWEDRAPLLPYITHLPATPRYQVFYLYLVLDLFSRFIVGWLIAEKQSGDYAQRLLAASFRRFQLKPDQLTIHSDNGGPMTAKPVAWLFSELGIQPSLSRPHVPNDNPHAEAGYKTLKYHPTYPDRFDGLSHAQAWMRDFERWYCCERHHTALGLMTPAAVHFGQAEELWLKRQAVLREAYQTHPERFSRGQPIPPHWPDQVGINAPQTLRVSGECLLNDTKFLPSVSKTP